MSGLSNPPSSPTTITGTVAVSNLPGTQLVQSIDGGLASVGTTTDASTATTLVGLLKAIKAAVTGVALDATLTGRTAKTQITDGTRDGTVKAASTLPVATDTAVVVTLRDALAAGSSLVGDVGLQPRTSGGLTPHKLISAASTNATSLKNAAGQVYAVQVFNVNAAVRYLKFYDKASAPTVGTDTPVKTVAIPGNTSGAGAVVAWPQGIAFALGIAYALTTGIADSDSTAVGANEIAVNIDWK